MKTFTHGCFVLKVKYYSLKKFKTYLIVQLPVLFQIYFRTNCLDIFCKNQISLYAEILCYEKLMFYLLKYCTISLLVYNFFILGKFLYLKFCVASLRQHFSGKSELFKHLLTALCYFISYVSQSHFCVLSDMLLCVFTFLLWYDCALACSCVVKWSSTCIFPVSKKQSLLNRQTAEFR